VHGQQPQRRQLPTFDMGRSLFLLFYLVFFFFPKEEKRKKKNQENVRAGCVYLAIDLFDVLMSCESLDSPRCPARIITCPACVCVCSRKTFQDFPFSLSLSL
jgi:hypothetical protein